MMAVTTNGQRPEMPADPMLLLGGSLPGLPEYRELMEACWDAEPGARPSAEQASFRPCTGQFVCGAALSCLISSQQLVIGCLSSKLHVPRSCACEGPESALSPAVC